MITIMCKQCKKPIETYPSRKGRKKFCSKKCQYTHGCPDKVRYKIHKANKGKRYSIATEFKKGHTPMSSINPEIMPRGKDHHKWKGGHVIDMNGYIWIRCINHPMANHGYVYEHRLLIEQHLDRYLSSEETVHHINEVKTDNRIKNFMVFATTGYHTSFHQHGYCSPHAIIFDGRKL